MFIRRLVPLAVIAALGLMAVGAATATADPSFLRQSGFALPSGTNITDGASDPAVLTVGGLGTITCNSTVFNATVGASGGASITGTLNNLSFTTCADTIPVIDITSCSAVATLPGVILTGIGATTGTVTLSDTKVFCRTTLGTSGCYYTAATATGFASGSTLAYSNVAVTHTTGTNDLGSLCGTAASFSATLTDLETSTGVIVLGNT